MTFLLRRKTQQRSAFFIVHSLFCLLFCATNYSSARGEPALPLSLSNLNIFKNLETLEPVAKLYSYDVQMPLWSDGAEKKRFVFLAQNTQIDASDPLQWKFPPGVLLVKHFSIGKRRIETRVIRRESDGWTFASYIWTEAQDEAIRTDEGAEIALATSSGRPLRWRVPTALECTLCHHDQTNAPLGIKTAQFGQHQLANWIDQKRIANGEDPATLHYFPRVDDSKTPGSEKARAYLDANCAHCHSPTGYAPGGMDMRESTDISAMQLVGVWPMFGDFDIQNALRIMPANKELSVLWHRMRNTDGTRMPAMGSRLEDTEATKWIGEWIDALSPSKSASAQKP